MNIDYRNLTAVNDFRNPQDFIYNSDFVEFTEFGAQLKDLVDPNIVAGATFTKNYLYNYSSKIFEAPFVYGSVIIQNERLALVGGVFNKQWTTQVKTPSKLGDVLPKGEIYFTYYPNYSNTPQTTQQIFTFGRIAEGFDKKNLIDIQHTSTGDFLFTIYDKAGNPIEENLSFPIEYANTPISFAISYDTERTPGNDARVKFNLFMNERSVVKFDLDEESFDINKVAEMSFGNIIGAYKPNFSIKNFVIKKDCPLLDKESYEESGDHVYSIPETRYTTTPQKVKPVFHVELQELKNIVALTNNSDDIDRGFYINYTFEVNGIEYFFDRTDLTWKIHKSPDQISDLGYMLAYKEQLLGNKTGLKFKCVPYLRTVKGDYSPMIVSQTITYDQYMACQEQVPMALIYGYVKDATGKGLSAKVVVTPSHSTVAEVGNFILPLVTKTVRTDVNGYWDIQLPLSHNFHPELLYNFQVIYRDEVVYQRANVRVSTEGTIKYEDLISEIQPNPIVPTPGQNIALPDNYIKGMIFQEIE